MSAPTTEPTHISTDAARAQPAGAGQTGVLIVGAGPAGLMLGCELARRGIPVLLAEKDAGPAHGSRGKGLQPRTQEIFEDLGLLDQVRALGGLYPPIQAHQGGAVVFEGRMDPVREVTPDVPYPNVWMLPQWRTAELLRARLAELGGSVRYGCELESVSQDNDGVTAVLRADGGPATVIRADYLVGADGGHSAVRRALGIGFAGQTREEQRMIVADVRADGVSADFWHVYTAHQDGQDAFRLGLCPLAGTGQFQLTAPVAAGRPVPDLSLSALQQIVDEAAGPGLIRITDVGWTSLYRTNIRMAERFRDGRAFLVGDAAHVHSPAGGQGLNTSIQDSYNLGWKLAAVLHGAPGDLLDSYQDERLPVAADVLGISTRLHDKAAGNDEGALRRDDPELRQLNLGYAGSQLSREHRAAPGAVRAGDRAPDAPGHDAAGRPARLFTQIHGGQTTLLAFGLSAAALAARLVSDRPTATLTTVAVVGPAESGRPAESAAQALFLDTGGHARRGYGIGADQDVLLVVRPDGYLGLALDAAEPQAAGQVRAYLAATGPDPARLVSACGPAD